MDHYNVSKTVILKDMQYVVHLRNIKNKVVPVLNELSTTP
jgi:hypothetical protein